MHQRYDETSCVLLVASEQTRAEKLYSIIENSREVEEKLSKDVLRQVEKLYERLSSNYSGICCTTSPPSTLPLACLLRLMPSLPQVPHCLKKKAASWASV